MRYGYDGASRVTDTFDGENDYTNHVLDGNGNGAELHEPEGQVTTYSYDELNKLLGGTQEATEDHPAPVPRYEYDENRNRRFQYAANGNEISLTDPKEQIVTSQYDEINRLKTTTYAFATGDSFRPWRHTTGIAYGNDKNSNPTSIDETVASGTDPPELTHLVTSSGYDSLNRLEGEATTLPDGDTRTVGYSYFGSGTRQSVTDPEMGLTSYSYDGQNRLKTATTAASATAYGYFGDDLLHTVSYPNGVTATHGYDKADRILSLVNARDGPSRPSSTPTGPSPTTAMAAAWSRSRPPATATTCSTG